MQNMRPFLPLFAESSQTESYRNIMDGRPVFLCVEFKVDKSKINLEGGFGKHIDGALSHHYSYAKCLTSM